ncbi:thiamine phosphate synthase [Leadbettera azotonutricia]|uniref:Thiamine monophosphate synthase n=1 Tax=Leadbettera azotonutricia (strain ATCC BAA-888 / DSM 13862 / ZAS-9) TaxID=545695 RepID=F5YA24_LEAAZ|nr:thiamine phosphate synthase [Leadbettera azotonutricia]AEF81566.1 thiamine monophosphate synthase [Leadbettera azotonutricia ZAS-9]
MRIVGVTNRLLCGGENGFLAQVKKIAVSGIDAFVLREKDLSLGRYEDLARKVLDICRPGNVELILHTQVEAAIDLNAKSIQLPWAVFKTGAFISADLARLRDRGIAFGVSVHSAEEAAEAERSGAAWLIAGHVFVTDCKKGLEPRGLEFIGSVCRAVKIPVYAIGGISEYTIAGVEKCGTEGVCIMSSLMESPDPPALIAGLRSRLGAACFPNPCAGQGSGLKEGA